LHVAPFMQGEDEHSWIFVQVPPPFEVS